MHVTRRPTVKSIQGFGTRRSSEAPNATSATRNVITMKPIMRRIGMPAMARIGKAKKGWIIFATDSPMATAIVVPAKEACSSFAAGKINGP